MTTKITSDNIATSVPLGTEWQAVKTANYTAVAGQGIFCNTTGGAFTVTLPASPTIGDEVTIVDYAGTFATNNLTIARNGSPMDGNAADSVLDAHGTNVRFVYIDGTKGWTAVFDDLPTELGATYIAATGGTESTSGNYKIHTFNSSSNFVVSQIGNPGGGPSVVDYLVVAGGGGAGGSGYTGGGGGYGSGAGGAGGYRESKSPVAGTYTASPLATPTGITVTSQTYPITIGAGGSGGPTPAPSLPAQIGANGSPSVFSTITSTGGGGGAGATTNGQDGGSGGGKSNEGAAGSGNTPPVSPSQGNNGGTTDGNGNIGGGGGGGAGGAGGQGGASPSPAAGGTGGAATTSEINGSPTARAGGGGGGGGKDAPASAPGGSATGGGGAGASTGNAGSAGTANTGGGGGASGGNPGKTGGAGGSGIVILRYKYQN